MGKGKTQKIISIAVLALAVVMIVMGVVGLSTRGNAAGQKYLNDMRNRAVLVATGEGAVESQSHSQFAHRSI